MSTMFRARPGEWLLLGVMLLACGLTLLAGLGGDPARLDALTLHGGLAVGFGALLAFTCGTRHHRAASALCLLVSVALIAGLYTTLGRLGFLLHGGSVDGALAAADVALFGAPPALFVEELVNPAGVELLSFVYLLHLGALYLTLTLELLRGEARVREAFLFGLTLTYIIGYAGYLIWPAHGPIWFYADAFRGALPDGPMFRAMMGAVEGAGGAIGAFPSLHVGASLYLCLFNLRHRRMRGLTYIPWVALIAASTVYLRHHYVVDWLGGALAAGVGVWLTPAALDAWSRGRARAGLSPWPRPEARVAPRPTRGLEHAAPWRRAFYRLFRSVSDLGLRALFPDRRVEGLEHVPAEGPVIFVSNHTNGLVDPLLVMSVVDRHVTLTAKHTLMKQPLLRALIHGLGIVLLRRARDGGAAGERHQRNAHAIADLESVLARGGAALLFPEGRSHCLPHLDAFRPGAARLALARCAAGAPATLIPVGLSYADKARLGSAVVVRFGAPLPHAAEDTPEALTVRIKAAVERALRPAPRPAPEETARRRWADALESVEISLLGLPMTLLGLLVNALPALALRRLIEARAVDPDHPATFALYGGMVICPLAYALQGALVALCFGAWWGLSIAALSAPAGLYAVRWLAHLGALPAAPSHATIRLPQLEETS